MTNEEILQKTLEKAKANGWEPSTELWNYHKDKVACHLLRSYVEMKLYMILILDHDFAKAFWGNQYLDELHAWQYHLQQMVLEEEPLKYLEKFL